MFWTFQYFVVTYHQAIWFFLKKYRKFTLFSIYKFGVYVCLSVCMYVLIFLQNYVGNQGVGRQKSLNLNFVVS